MTPNITDEQRKQIEEDAIEFANKEWGNYDGAGLFNKANWKVTKDDYAAGATKYATLCHQKDEEIARLRTGLEEIKAMFTEAGDPFELLNIMKTIAVKTLLK